MNLAEFKGILEKEKNIEIECFDYRSEIDKDTILKVIEKGKEDILQDFYDYNIDYICEVENEWIENILNDYEDEIRELFKDIESAKEFIQERVPGIDLNIDRLMNHDITVLIPLYSNYDCTNSFDTLEASDYLRQVLRRVKSGVLKEDFIWEHKNGAYGGSLFCFAFNCTLQEYLNLKEQVKNGKYLVIPKGTQYGFFSSFQGSSSPFEKETFQDFKLKIKENTKDYIPEYDHIGIIADIEQNYSLQQVFGSTDFVKSQNLLIA